MPKHVWSSISDPVKSTNDTPVATGPYKLKTFNGQQMVLERNPTY